MQKKCLGTIFQCGGGQLSCAAGLGCLCEVAHRMVLASLALEGRATLGLAWSTLL